MLSVIHNKNIETKVYQPSWSTQIKASTSPLQVSPSVNLKESDTKINSKEFKFPYRKVSVRKNKDKYIYLYTRI